MIYRTFLKCSLTALLGTDGTLDFDYTIVPVIYHNNRLEISENFTNLESYT
jgi:hypothetical protein